MRKVISIFQTISILIGFMIIVLFLIPTIAGIKPFIVLSGSMESTIKTGSVAYVNTHVKVQDIKVDDIIAFNVNNTQVTHRVIAINEDNTFTTKGDANKNEDFAPVKFEDYKGKTIFSIPHLGKVITTSQTKIGYFIVFVVIGLNILCLIFSGDNEKKGKIQDKNKIKENKNNTIKMNNDKQKIDQTKAINNDKKKYRKQK